MENDAPVVGPDVPTDSSKVIKPDIAIADWIRPTFCFRVIRWTAMRRMSLSASGESRRNSTVPSPGRIRADTVPLYLYCFIAPDIG